MPRIHKEGFSTIVYTGVGCLLLLIAVIVLCPMLVIPCIVLIIAIMVFILSFFRAPDRPDVPIDGYLVSPCDGKVVVIEEVQESEFIEGPCRQISIFMSPLNVHINWHPISAKVAHKAYHPGKYLVAWHPKSSTQNERMSIGYQYNSSRILVRQIAGAVARRIVNYSTRDTEVRQGSEMGFIKFGSRVDLFIPLHWKLQVNPDDVVVGTQTKLAKLGS